MKRSITTLSVGVLGVVLVMAPGCSHKSLKYSSGDHQWGEEELASSMDSESNGEWALTFSPGMKSGPEGWSQDGGNHGASGKLGSERYQPGVIDPADPRNPRYAGEHGTEEGYPMIRFGKPQQFSNGSNDSFSHSSPHGLMEAIEPGPEGMPDGVIRHDDAQAGLKFYSSPHGATAPLQGELGSLPEFEYGVFEEGDGRNGWGTPNGQFSQEYMGDEFPIASVSGSPSHKGERHVRGQSFAGSGTNLFPDNGSGVVIPSRGAHQGHGLGYRGTGGSDGLQDVFFEFDRWTITPDYSEALSFDKEWVSSNRPASLTIEGHSDLRGTQNYNLVLGQKRAKAVQSYLIDLGVDPSMLKVISYGEERPFCRETTEQCYQLNRRGHLVADK